MTTSTITPGLFDRSGAASYLSIGQTKLRQLVAAKEIEKVHVDGAPRYPRESLDAYITRLRRSA